ncbi:MAG: NlpC/P60 family protein [Pseudomonadota bacterium]
MLDRNDRRIAPPNTALPQRAVVTAPHLPLFSAAGERVSSAVYGEPIEIYERRGDCVLIRSGADHYVGWARLKGLGPWPDTPPTHWISAPMTNAFSEPDLKSMPKAALFLGSRFSVAKRDGNYLLIDDFGWVPRQHARELGERLPEPSAVALGFMGTPYLWGGRDATGLDCSALVQLAFGACGARLPRDSDMQFAWSGVAIEAPLGPGTLQKNDLVFWKGHVGLMLDAETLIHANANHMAVALEPLEVAVKRIATLYGPPTGARRITFPHTAEPDWFVR